MKQCRKSWRFLAVPLAVCGATVVIMTSSPSEPLLKFEAARGSIPQLESLPTPPIICDDSSCPGRIITGEFRRIVGPVHEPDRPHSTSERNPVPTVQGFEKDQVNQAQSEEQLEREVLQRSDSPNVDSSVKEKQNDQQNAGLEEKKELMEKMGNPKAKPTDQVKRRRGERVVDDPVTGQKVVIKDHSLKGKASRTM